MPRKFISIAVGLLLTSCVSAAGLVCSLKHQPAFYKAALESETNPADRKEQAKRFVQTTLQLADALRNEEQFSEDFSEDQVNSWLAEELEQKYGEWTPEGVSQPRIKFESANAQIAFRVQQPYWSGIVTVQLKPWILKPNQLALEVQSVRAGLLPIPLDNLLQGFATEVNALGMKTEWRQVAGNDVLVIHLQDDLADSPAVDAVNLTPGKLQISGRRQRLSQAQSFLPQIAERDSRSRTNQ